MHVVGNKWGKFKLKQLKFLYIFFGYTTIFLLIIGKIFMFL